MTQTQPLLGLSVLEFSHTVMGPCAGLLLADLGADVIKVEPSPNGDRTRGLPGFASGFFATFNRNKRSLAVDLKSLEGQGVVHQLAKSADIVIENYGPGTMERLGCSWPTLSALNNGLIYLNLKGYLKGPYQDKPALDEVVQFESGLAYMTGPVGQPLRAGASIVDILGAVFGVTGVLAALREREKTGKGQLVGSALFESAAFLMTSHIAGGAALGQEVPPMTARKGAWGVYDVFETAQSESLFIGVTSDNQWKSFCVEFNYLDLLEDARLNSNANRTAARDWLLPILQNRIKAISFEAASMGCERAGISWSPIARPEQLQSHPQLTANDGLIPTSLLSAVQTVIPETLLPALPLEFGNDRERPRLNRQPPTLGQHSREILAALRYSTSDVDNLIAARVVKACE